VKGSSRQAVIARQTPMMIALFNFNLSAKITILNSTTDSLQHQLSCKKQGHIAPNKTPPAQSPASPSISPRFGFHSAKNLE